VLTCQDECQTGAGRCVDDASYQVCGNYDEDPCREFSATTSACDEGTFCHRTECIGLVPPAVVVLNELLFDGPSTDPDDVFLELRGPGGLSLDHFSVENVNGTDGDIAKSVDLLGATIPGDGYFVVVHPEALGTPGNPALAAVADFSSTSADFQNGPDSVRLLWGGRTTVDALGYGFPPYSDELPNFAGETESVPPSSAGQSLTRDENSVDSDVNRWDFRISDAPTPGAAYVPVGWTKRAVTGPDDANPGIAFIDLAADVAGALRAAFVRNGLDAVETAAWTGGGAWQVEVVTDEFLYQPADAIHYLYWVSPPAVDPAGGAAVATLGSVYVESAEFPELDGFRGVRLGYSEKLAGEWEEELVVALPEEDFLGIPGRWIWTDLGLRHARLADGSPVVAFLVVDQVAEVIYLDDLTRGADGTWTERIGPELEVTGDFDLVADRDGTLHLFTIAGLPEIGFELHHRSAQGTGAWSEPEVVVPDLLTPGSVSAASDAASAAVNVCVLDYTRLEGTAEGDLGGGAAVVRCARSGAEGWTVETAIAQEDGFFPIDVDVAAEGAGVALVVTEFYQRAVWFFAKDAGAVWQRELVDFGGETGLWPALAVTPQGHQVLFGAATPLRGIGHAED